MLAVMIVVAGCRFAAGVLLIILLFLMRGRKIGL